MTNKALELNQAIKQLEEVKNYLQLKEALKSNEEVLTLLEEIGSKQKEMQNALKANDMKNYHIYKNELEVYKQRLFQNIDISSYIAYKEDTASIIDQLVTILSD